MERIRMKQRFWQLAAAGVVAVGALAPATVAYAADYPDSDSTSTVIHPDSDSTGTVIDDPGRTSAEVQVAGKTQARGQLPFTGGDIAALAAIGGGAVAIGGVLVVQTRKRRVAEAG
jgi:hypothetical protein